MKKLIKFEDFNKKNQEIKENIDMTPKFGISENEKIERIEDFLENADDGVIDHIINYLRDVLLEMEQQGFIDEDTTDRLDDQYDGDWIGWISAVIELDEFPEDALNGVYDIIDNQEDLELEDDEVECPDCDGTGQDEMGEDCERCDGTGRVYRPDDIPPDEFDYEDDDEDLEFED